MTDCSSMHGSTSSSDITSSRGSNPRVRIVRLTRPQFQNHHNTLLNTHQPTQTTNNPSFGFSLRGGREFGTGFFISRVEKGSEADLQGLRIGDQIIRVNGYHVDDAVHKELSQFISNQDRLTLKVRGVGIIPVKERSSDPLTWHVVPLKIAKSYDVLDDISCRDIRITLSVAPRTKLGCGICKGPEWKPGIFIQFTKDGGIAREAGLRPGDQILSCNGIDFSDILFSDAVGIMKSSHVLELLVRTCAGLDLFPGESSGYNSSASSVTGDQSPCWGDQASKRLSIVREESLNSTERRSHFRPKSKDRIDLDRRKERMYAVVPPKAPKTSETQTPQHNNRTIIKLSENGTVINNTLIPNSTNQRLDECSKKESTKLADICFVSRQSETKTVIVEVHRSASTDSITKAAAGDVPPPPPPCNQDINHDHDRSPSVISSASSVTSSSLECSSLSSAISEELKRRAEKKSLNPTLTNDESNVGNCQTKKFGNPLRNNDERHNALMDEFKKAHKRMFKNGFKESEKPKDEEERQSEINNRKLLANNQNNDHKVVNRKVSNNFHTNSIKNGVDVADNVSRKIANRILENNHVVKPNHAPPPPPPAPPLPQNNSQQPKIPTPDYDSLPSPTASPQKTSQPITAKGTMGRCAASEIAKANGDIAEMESIESFKMTNPSSPAPRPPSYYFAPQNSGPPTMKKSQRQIAVTIGEYGNNNSSGGSRKEPCKFDFIGSKPNGNVTKSIDISQSLKNELEKTLSRSNLKKRSDSIENLLEADRNSLNGGKTTITFLNQKEINNNNVEKPILQKTQSSNIERLSSMLQQKQQNGVNGGNRVTIAISNVNNKMELRKTESSPPLNGILKNSDNLIQNGGHTKNIKFENIT